MKKQQFIYLGVALKWLFFCEKFNDHETPKYIIQEIDCKQLDVARDFFDIKNLSLLMVHQNFKLLFSLLI